MRRFLFIVAAFAACLAMAAPGALAKPPPLHHVKHFVVIYLENHSFDNLYGRWEGVDGIRRADAESVAALYWNSPQLLVFNNNGTVTKSWEQARSNRESLYAKVSDVKLDVRDVRVKALGPSAAVVTCLWEQSQTADGQPERATGRLTIVYQKVGAAWKIVHTHTSPDKPNPSNLLPSERTPAGADATPAKPPAKP